MEYDYTLRMYNSVLLGGGGTDLTHLIDGWSRTILEQGGYWLGDFDMTEGGKLSEFDLTTFFNQNLGKHIEEKSGGIVTWEGRIYEMYLTISGVTRKVSLADMYNYHIAIYGDNLTTAAAYNTPSINTYGQREMIHLMSGYTATAAEAKRDSQLARWGNPVASPVGIGDDPEKPATLNVIVAGYAHTMADEYESVGDGSEDNLSTWLSDMITTDCPFLSTGLIATNTLQVTTSNARPVRVSEVVDTLVDLGDADGNLYRAYVENNRRFYYQIIDTTPAYWMRGGVIRGSAGGSSGVNPWTVKPGVCRATDYPIDISYSGGWLQSSRDFYIEKVTCGTGTGLVLGVSDYGESDVLSAQMEYQHRLENATLESAGGAGGTTGWGGSRHIYEHMGYKKKDWLGMSDSQKLNVKKAWWAKRRAKGKRAPKP